MSDTQQPQEPNEISEFSGRKQRIATTIYLTPDIYKMLKELSAEMEITQNTIIINLIKMAYKHFKEKKKVNGEKKIDEEVKK